MELNILHLYPDCMSLYGEYANVAVLKRHLEALGVTVNVKKNGLAQALFSSFHGDSMDGKGLK